LIIKGHEIVNSETLYLVDASPYIFRAYYSLPLSITTPQGEPANAVYGFANFLIQLTKRDDLTHLGIAFDESLTTSFRNEIYADYKAQRTLPPPELEAQLEVCQQVAQAFGAATFVSERYEADDLIGSLVSQLRGRVHKIVIVSGDKDLAQLVDGAVVLFDFAKDRWFDEAGVRDYFGVQPAQIADLLALQGDSVDNIPGVKGIGGKTAQVLLQNFANIGELYDRLDEIAALPIRGAKAVATRLAAGRDQAFLSKQLATIAADIPLEADLHSLIYEGARSDLLDPLFDQLGFKRIRERIPRWYRGESA
jgi:5'-3' exonuclease